MSRHGTDDAALVYAFAPPDDVKSGHLSLQALWDSGVKDWGAIALTRRKCVELQAADPRADA